MNASHVVPELPPRTPIMIFLSKAANCFHDGRPEVRYFQKERSVFLWDARETADSLIRNEAIKVRNLTTTFKTVWVKDFEKVFEVILFGIEPKNSYMH